MAKVVGILFCIASVAILAFYKGPHFNPPQSLHFIEISNPNVSASGAWLEGALFLVIAILSWSLGLIFMVNIAYILPRGLLHSSQLQYIYICMYKVFELLLIGFMFLISQRAWLCQSSRPSSYSARSFASRARFSHFSWLLLWKQILRSGN